MHNITCEFSILSLIYSGMLSLALIPVSSKEVQIILLSVKPIPAIRICVLYAFIIAASFEL